MNKDENHRLIGLRKLPLLKSLNSQGSNRDSPKKIVDKNIRKKIYRNKVEKDNLEQKDVFKQICLGPDKISEINATIVETMIP